jgi:protein SCO1
MRLAAARAVAQEVTAKRRSRRRHLPAFVAAALLWGIAAQAAPQGGPAPPVPSPVPSAVPSAVPGLDGRFALETAAGRAVTEASFAGKWLLVYFGYTACPDACPTALSNIVAALGALGPLAARIQPLFITVDPKRDTPAVLAKYVKTFDPRIVGLYGTAEQTAAAAKAFRVYYAVRQLGNGEYAIDHSAFVYVVNPGGRVVELLTGNIPGRTMAAALRDLMK